MIYKGDEFMSYKVFRPTINTLADKFSFFAHTAAATAVLVGVGCYIGHPIATTVALAASVLTKVSNFKTERVNVKGYLDCVCLPPLRRQDPYFHSTRGLLKGMGNMARRLGVPPLPVRVYDKKMLEMMALIQGEQRALSFAVGKIWSINAYLVRTHSYACVILNHAAMAFLGLREQKWAVAHEMGHFAADHTNKELLASTLTMASAICGGIAVGLSFSGGLPAIAEAGGVAAATMFSAALIESSARRSHEYQADRLALALTRRPQDMLSYNVESTFFEKVVVAEYLDGYGHRIAHDKGRVLSRLRQRLFASHPPDEQRQLRIARHARAMGLS